MCTPDDTADPLADAAEAVRAHLVTLRGGAPFLSSADARLLMRWLDDGVPVPLILSELDRVAERRRRRRTRGRLHLSSARRAVEKAWGAPSAGATAGPTAGPARDALVAWLDAVAAQVGEAGAGLVTVGRDRVREGGDLEALLSDLAGACRRAHEARWRADPARQEALRQAAAEALAPLAGSVSESVWADLVEESARARLRADWPLVSAAELWDRVAESQSAVEP